MALYSSDYALADDSTDATKAAAKAFYYQVGINNSVDKLKKWYIDPSVSKNWQDFAANCYLIAKMVDEQRITYEWKF